jgi:hypothetical protein
LQGTLNVVIRAQGVLVLSDNKLSVVNQVEAEQKTAHCWHENLKLFALDEEIQKSNSDEQNACHEQKPSAEGKISFRGECVNGQGYHYCGGEHDSDQDISGSTAHVIVEIKKALLTVNSNRQM